METITYTIIGWTDKTAYEDFARDYKSKHGVYKKFQSMIDSECYEMIVIREEKVFTYCSLKISKPIELWMAA